jgi:hypothetical protein
MCTLSRPTHRIVRSTGLDCGHNTLAWLSPTVPLTANHGVAIELLLPSEGMSKGAMIDRSQRHDEASPHIGRILLSGSFEGKSI